MNDPHQSLRDHVLFQLRGGGAHLNFDAAIANLPDEARGAKVGGIAHSAWQLVEHLRICQWDILEYCRDPNHVSPNFPDGLWPSEAVPPDDAAWQESVSRFHSDLAAMQDLVRDPANDLLAQIPHGEQGHTLLREAWVLCDHNAYHIGQLVALRQALGVW